MNQKNQKLQELVEKRNKFLEDHPELMDFQNKIDVTLNTVVGSTDEETALNRLKVLSFMLEEKMLDMNSQMKDLSKLIYQIRASGIINDEETV